MGGIAFVVSDEPRNFQLRFLASHGSVKVEISTKYTFRYPLTVRVALTGRWRPSIAATTIAVETVVLRHLDAQTAVLSPADPAATSGIDRVSNVISEVRRAAKANLGARQFFDDGDRDNVPMYLNVICWDRQGTQAPQTRPPASVQQARRS